MKPIDYLFRQMELEGIRRSAEHLIDRMAPEVEDFPLVLLAHTCDEQKIAFFDEALPHGLCEQLYACDPGSLEEVPLIDLFEKARIQAKVGHFRTYIFPEGFCSRRPGDVSCFKQDDARVAVFGFQGMAENVFAVEQDGRIASACVSSRQNAACGEAWVFTHPGYRRRGFAGQAVTAWAGSLLREGLIPFYSHSIENIASARLAEHLGLIHVFDEMTLEAT